MLTDLSPRNGFSLLEVLLAILILGLTLTVVFSSANQGLAVVTQAKSYQISRGLLQELDLREPLDLEELEEGELRGTFTHFEHGAVQWTRIVSQEGAEEDRFYRLSTEITWGGNDQEHTESVETFIHQPTAISGGWVQEPLDDF